MSVTGGFMTQGRLGLVQRVRKPLKAGRTGRVQSTLHQNSSSSPGDSVLKLSDSLSTDSITYGSRPGNQHEHNGGHDEY